MNYILCIFIYTTQNVGLHTTHPREGTETIEVLFLEGRVHRLHTTHPREGTETQVIDS